MLEILLEDHRALGAYDVLARLAADGFRTVGDLQAADPARLASRYGALGLRIVKLSRGEDSRHVVPNSKRKSVGSEVTFFEDLADIRDLRPILREQAERVSFGLKHEDIAGSSVTMEQVLELAPENWYVEANEAMNLGLIEGVI